MKTIGVDIDEVLAETYRYFLEHVDYKLGDKNLYFEDLVEYDFWKLDSIDIDKQTVMDLWYETMSDHIININPVQGAFEKLQTFKSNNYRLVAVTGRSFSVQKQTYDWLDKHFTGIFDKALFANRGLKKEKKKSQLIKDLDIEIFFDDNIDYAKDIASIGVPTYLFTKPWNKNTSIKHPNIIRVNGWKDIDII